MANSLEREINLLPERIRLRLLNYSGENAWVGTTLVEPLAKTQALFGLVSTP